MAENREKIERPQNKNLIVGGPGRPKGQKNYATIYREALEKIANSKGMTPEEIEIELEEVGLNKGLKGNFAFWKDIRDRIHGKPRETVDLNAHLTVEGVDISIRK